MKRKGFTLIELLVVIAIIALLMGILMPALSKARQLAIRLLCGTQLKGIGAAMVVYAADMEDEYPVAGGVGATWVQNGIIHRWDAPAEAAAFGITAATPGKATITSSFFLLTKFAKVTPKQFVCKGDGAIEFKLTNQTTRLRDLALAWDFGRGRNPDRIYPGGYCSYSYQMPYAVSPTDVTNYRIIEGSKPGMPVCADRNPYLDRNADTSVSQNAAAHAGKVQNVLFKDGSVSPKDNPSIGIGDNNMWLYGDDPMAGTAGSPPTLHTTGVLGEISQFDADAFLVNEMN
jgi:prepilin-type N-terminal cleavage/methylation domain-containing protein